MANLDMVKSAVGGRVVGLLDSPLWIDVTPLDESLISLKDQTR